MSSLRTFKIAANNKSAFIAQLEKLNKRATKIGAEESTCTFSKAFNDKDGNLSIKVEVNGPFTIQADGWRFIATLQHLVSGETLIHSLTDDVIPNHYKVRGSLCDHCGINRKRNATYLLMDEMGDITQVGSSCMSEFLGGFSADSYLRKADFAADLIKSLGAMDAAPSVGATQYYLPSFLQTVSAIIREHGWVPKSKAATMGKPTIEIVMDNLCPPTVDYPVCMIQDEDVELTDAVVAWAENLSDAEVEKSDYMFNIRSIALGGAVEMKTGALASSMIASYKANMSYHGPKDSKKSVSKHLGNVGDVLVVEATLRIFREFTGSQYTSYFYSFEDAACNAITWKASRNQALVEGKTYMVKGTIKAHSYYRDTAQTDLTRCSVYLLQ
jgi:hypothetical protein